MRKINKSRTLMKLGIIAIIIGSVILSGCEVLGHICGCSRDEWTSDHSDYCYTNEDQCERETGESCYECR